MLMKTFRTAVCAALALLPLAAASPAHADSTRLHEAVDRLPLAAESRDGYQRTSFKHWVDADRDGCNTRAEVLIAESRTPVEMGPKCKIVSGEWFSYYDQQHVADPKKLDIDHMVPLAEAWDSGASQWTAARRQAYANDLDASRSLVAVTAKTNRSKADQDPAQWMPPAAEARCTYLADWISTKLRWSLTVDHTERDALQGLVAACPDTELTYALA
ncbi:HNH endonuclease family protein (plasmid) [Streptomyces sp. NBC_01525]|uniref:HNH endonuclease family protein n=1 Tax=Streptomyces sp. NBC_01525 TaxID=2903893 RepID=UPI002F906953